MSNPTWGPPGTGAFGASGAGDQPQVCFRHPDRPTGLRCSRCGRSACPECLREAPVGFHCVDCLAQGQREQRQAATVAGAPLTRATPLLTYALIGVNVLFFLVTVLDAGGQVLDNNQSGLFRDLALWPYGVALGDWWRLLSSGFLHFGPLHLLVNMFALYILGRDLEVLLGRWRFAAVYLVSLLGGSAAVMLFADPRSLTAGASGAIFGLMGGLVVVLLRLRRSVSAAVAIIAINVVIGLSVPGISLAGHLGGLVVGAAATAALVYAPRGRTMVVQVSALVVLGLVTVAVIVGRVLALRSQVGL